MEEPIAGASFQGLGYLPPDVNDSDPKILFKHDRLYRHSLIRINYTSYDVQRSQDVVNPSTSHRNVMVLRDPNADDDDDSSRSHPFRYARVLGIYHANVIYIGRGMVNYQPQRMEFLWVRWYRHNTVTSGWSTRKLDRIHFAPMASDDAFGFIDPSDVLRGCHIIPAFVTGQVHTDGKGLSRCSHDSLDWVAYYVAR
jgi:hypothetical protein